MRSKIKVLNVDDSAFIRKLLRDVFLTEKSTFEVDQARNGKEALQMLKLKDYDVITLDIEMPVMNGITTLKEIMRIKPTSVVMLSSAAKEDAKVTLDALELGAVDFITKPQNIFTINLDDMRNDILQKVKYAAKYNHKVSRRTSKPVLPKVKTHTSAFTPGDFSESVKKIIAIGTSTGGPRALNEVIPNISGNIQAPVLIVQHMPKGFTKSLADRLNSVSQVRVKEAEDGEILKNGIAYIAPGGYHLKIRSCGIDKYRVYLDNSESVNGHKPSVDAMMFSLLESSVKELIAVIMTGMGSDGAKGLELLKMEKNAITIAEDEKTCVVYGMPKAAFETGKVDTVLPLNKIAGELNKLMGV